MGNASGWLSFQRSPSRTIVNAPRGPSTSTRVTLSRSKATTVLSRTAATVLGRAVQTSSGTSITLDSPARIA